MMWPFVIILSGPPAVGKNTIAQQICRAYPLRMAEIDLDRVKYFVHDAPSTDFFLDLASALGQSMLSIYLKAEISVVIHKAFCSFDFVRPFINICKECGVDYRYFKLEAPLEELIKRNPNRLYPSPEEDLRRIYDFDKQCTHREGITIDTAKLGIAGASKRIIESVPIADAGNSFRHRDG